MVIAGLVESLILLIWLTNRCTSDKCLVNLNLLTMVQSKWNNYWWTCLATNYMIDNSMNSADPPEFRVRWYLAGWWSKSFLWWQCTIVSSINGNSMFHFSPSYEIEGLIYALQVCVSACDDHSNVGPGSCGIKTNGRLAWTLLVKNWTPWDERKECLSNLACPVWILSTGGQRSWTSVYVIFTG